jgi:hypothetical protein
MFIFTAFNRDTFYAKEIIGDSNRMFTSSAVLVDNDGNGHQKLRTRPARYTVSKWNWFSQFIKQEMIHVFVDFFSRSSLLRANTKVTWKEAITHISSRACVLISSTLCENVKSYALKMEAVRASETSIYFNEITRCYIPESCLQTEDKNTCIHFQSRVLIFV